MSRQEGSIRDEVIEIIDSQLTAVNIGFFAKHMKVGNQTYQDFLCKKEFRRQLRNVVPLFEDDSEDEDVGKVRIYLI